MNEMLLLTFLHLLCLVYWLGGDLGVFYSSFYVADETNPVEVRLKVAKILFALDQAPRICMTLMLPTGYHLAHVMGLVQLPAATIWLLWLLGLLWLTMVLALHFRPTVTRWLARIDHTFRLLLIASLAAVAVTSLLGQGWLLSKWLPIKLLVFAGLIVCGLMIRCELAPFGPAFAKLAQGEASAEVNATIRDSLRRSRPWVIMIWLGLLFNTALGLHLIAL